MQSDTRSAGEVDNPESLWQHKEMRRIITSSFLGNVIEFYDFMLYATAAAVVFGPLFFADQSPAVATFASFGTLAVGYLARPFGGVLFGHFGDRVGRKITLVVSMVGMGLATVLIGLLPTGDQVGAVAPVLLVCLRIVQGLAVGGEWGGAVLIALEHAPKEKRGFAASFANMGAGIGVALAALIFGGFTLLPEDQFLTWGWRIPFLLSFGLIAIGLFLRLKVSESPIFQELQTKAEKRRAPLTEVLRGHLGRVVLGLLAGLSIYAVAGIVAVWGLSFAIEGGANPTGALNAKAAAALCAFAATYLGGKLSDRVGRKPVLLAGVIAGVIFAFPILYLLNMGTVAGYALAVILGQLIQGLLLGPIGAFVAELFPTRVRYTGASLSYQSASALGSGLTPAVASGILLLSDGNLIPVGIVWIVIMLVSGIAVMVAPEPRDTDLTKAGE